MNALREWLTFSDRGSGEYDSTQLEWVVTEDFRSARSGQVDAVGWRKEDWYWRSVLVPAEVAAEVLEQLSVYDRVFDFGWGHDDRFFFGESHVFEGVEVRPWLYTRRHPVSEDLVAEMRRDFRWYHALEEREPGRHWHPLEGVLVAEVRVDRHEIHDPTPWARVHRSYLGDFLAARGWGLVVVQVADRFANVSDPEELGIDTTAEVDIGARTTLRTTVQPLGSGREGSRGRGTLWRTLWIGPLDSPRYSSSPWPYFGRTSDATGAQATFIFNADGQRKALTDPECPAYLFFHRAVLERYLSDSTLRVHFHMRTWGAASGPGHTGSVDVGINEQGLVTAFAPDLKDLPVPLQQHWASFSRLPSGEVCREMFETRMQLRPPDSPSLVDLVRSSLNALDAVFGSRWATTLYTTTDPPGSAGHLTTGPITESEGEFLQLCKVLFRWMVEGMSISSLRTAVGEGRFEPEWRQIRLLTALLPSGSELPEALRGLNDLRIADAHVSTPDMGSAFRRIGLPLRSDSRERWLSLVDRISELVEKAAEDLGAME